MLGQNVLLELTTGDKVQLYAHTGTGLTDHKNSRYTQFIGMLLRPSVESMHAFVKKLGNPTDTDEVMNDNDDNDDTASIRSNCSTIRNLFSNDGSLMVRSRRNSRKNMNRQPSVVRGSSVCKDMTDQMMVMGDYDGRARALSPRLMSPSRFSKERSRTPVYEGVVMMNNNRDNY